MATRILHLEDIRSDAAIVQRELSKGQFEFELNWVTNRTEYVDAIKSFRPDIILSDHSLPQYDSIQAFRHLQETGLKIPFILVTATISEEFAVMMMRDGIADYLLKDRLQRLPVAIESALEKWESERQKEAFFNSLQRSEANLTAIIENSDASIYSLDTDFRYLTFNNTLHDTLKQVYGLDIKVGDVVFEFLDKLDPAEALEWKNRYSEALRGYVVKFVKEFAVGEYHSFTSFSLNPIRSNGEIKGLSCFAWDVTKEKIADEKWRRNEARYRALIENSYDAIVLRDEKMKVIYRSPSAKRIQGYADDESFDESVLNRVHPTDLDQLRKIVEESRQNPGKIFPLEYRLQRSDGGYIWAEGILRNMVENEDVGGFILNFRDITERKELELQREQMTADLIQRNKDLEQFAYIVSHNLRAPVANILGITNLYKQTAISPETEVVAREGIATSAQKLDEVIRDLNFILSKKMDVREKRVLVDFQLLLDDIRTTIIDQVSEHNVAFVADFSELPAIQTIRGYLYSVFYNLVSNSIKYRRPEVPPRVEIKSTKNNNRAVLVFKDNGSGINLEQHHEKVFGLYKRFHPGTEGKGMGLFMVKTQIEAIGGTVQIASEVDKGTQFTIDLPLEHES
jgi:PAS domain S-box-containing protein